MPRPASKKQSQRTKGNVRPSSSSQAAQLLSGGTGFVGFGTMTGSPGYVPASQALEDVDSSLDADFRLVLRKLTKKDSTTKIKALQEFSSLCGQKDVEDLKAVLPFWPRMYCRAALDVDHRVRETTQHAMTALVVQVRKHVAPYLRSVMGAWLLCQCDTYPTVSAAAVQAFQSAFPPSKQTDVLVYCHTEITQYFIDHLLNQTVNSLSDPKTTERDDMDNKYHRVMTSSLYGLRKLITSLPANQMASVKESLDTLLKDSKFWKFGKSSSTNVRAAMYSFLASLCQVQPELAALYSHKMAPHILHNLDEKDPVICPAVWEAALSLVQFVPDCWKHVTVGKAFWPKLRSGLENGFYGNMTLIGSDLLPFLSKVPADILGNDKSFYTEFFSYMTSGLSEDSVQTSPSECGAMVRAFVECCQYVAMTTQDKHVSSNILLEQMLPVVLASVLDDRSALHKSPLYSLTSGALSSLDSSLSDTVGDFWSQLGDRVLDRIAMVSPDADHADKAFVERCIHLVTCLVYPRTTAGQIKPEKVTFSIIGDERECNESVVERTPLSPGAGRMVQRITLKAFRMAQESSSAHCLHLFASLVELDPSEDTIRQVIEQCDGKVDGQQSHSYYFVFHVCLPWLQKVTSSAGTDPKQLLSVMCTFVALLDSDCVIQLLHQLCELPLGFGAFHHLLQKMLPLQSRFSSIGHWLKGPTFHKKVVSIATEVCRMSMTLDETDDREIEEGWSVVSLVLGGHSNWCASADLVQEILQTVHHSLLTLHNTHSAIKFVAKATHSFFLNTKSCLSLPSASDLLLTLFSVSLDNSWSVTDEILEDCESVWTVGLTTLLRQTGGLLQDCGVLGKAVAMVKHRVTKVTDLVQFDMLAEKVQRLTSVVKDSLPDGDKGDNPVLTSVIEDLYVRTQPNLTQPVMDHIMVCGDWTFGDRPRADGSEGSERCQGEETRADGSEGSERCQGEETVLYTVLYNTQLLAHTKHVAMETDRTVAPEPFSETEQDVLLGCLYGEQVVRVGMDIGHQAAQLDKFAAIFNRLESTLPRLVNVCSDRDSLVTKALSRCELGPDMWGPALRRLLHLLSENEHLTLDLAMLLDRCTDLDEAHVQLVQSVSGHIEPDDRLTLCQILVARLISCPLEAATLVTGGFGALACLTSVLPGVTRQNDLPECLELVRGALVQLMDWKEEDDHLLLLSCDLTDTVASLVLMNAEVAKFLTLAVKFFSMYLSDREWDFVMCTMVSMLQSVCESQSALLSSCVIQTYTVGVCRLLHQVAGSLQKVEETYPPNLISEWTEFFSESAFSALLPLYVRIVGDNKANPDPVLVRAMGACLAQCPKSQILTHQLPPLLIAGELSPLSDTLQTLMNQLCPLLTHRNRSVQITGFHLLSRVMSELPQYDQEAAEDEETNRTPPAALMKVLSDGNVAMEILLGDEDVDACLEVQPGTEEYQYTLAYLLTWKLLLDLFTHSPAELRQEYAGHFKSTGLLQKLMTYLFCLMPDKPPLVSGQSLASGQSLGSGQSLASGQSCTVFEVKPNLGVTDKASITEIQHVSSWVYRDTLQTMPAMARQWWLEQHRKTSAYVDKFTSKNISHLLCTEEMQSISSSDQTLDYITIRTRPTTREVIVTYSLEEVRTEMVICLPQNYPMGNIEVHSEKRVGVSAAQWEKWLLQLKIFLQYQNGSLFDGLRIWKRNVDKRFEGVDDCMICFSVLHGTNYQLPRLLCKTCKKKFHSACLYKWFQTSHNSTCPLCRNLF